jgi:MYXO-CTERM domain-containing protein
VTDPTSFGAWKLDEFWDTLPLGDAEIVKLDSGEDWPQAPQLVQADDGTPEVWLVDGKHRRHVPDPAVMSAWRLDWSAITTKPAAEVYANAEGPVLRSRPTLLHETNGAIWLVDEPIASAPGAGGSGGAGGGSAGAPSSTGGGKGISPSRELTEEAPNGCACSVPGERRQSAPTVFLALAVLAGAARSRLFRRRASSEPLL